MVCRGRSKVITSTGVTCPVIVVVIVAVGLLLCCSADYGLLVMSDTADTTPHFTLWGWERFFEELVQFLETCK